MKCQQNNPPKRYSVFASWYDVTRSELDKFLAVLINIGIQNKPSIKNYWSNACDSFTPWFGQMFPRRRSEALFHTMLHAAPNNAEGKEKIEPLIRLVIRKFQENFYPFQNLSLDEMIVGYKGRWAYKQYNPQKPHKYHIKSFALCDASTGYMFDVLTYFGTNTSYDPDEDPNSVQGIRIFSSLLKSLDCGHHIFADRYYTTKALIDKLTADKYLFTGTLNLNRRNFPPQLKQQRLAHLESRYYMSSDDKTLCVAYKGKKAKKEVVLVSTDADVSSDPTKKGTVVPSVIVTYNQNMNGCDKMDQLIGYYGIHNRKSVKWWKKLFFFLFEIAQANAYILHVLTAEANTRKTLLTFKRALLNQLTSERQENTAAEPQTPATQQKPVTAVPSARLNDTRHIIVAHKNDLRCVHCSKPSAPKRTKFYCSGCPNHPHLHPVCFAPYHSSV